MKRIALIFVLLLPIMGQAQFRQILTVDPNDLTQVQGRARTQKIMDHAVVLKDGKLQPWTTYSEILRKSMNFLKYCPTVKTIHGDDPLYVVTSKLHADGSFLKKQNNQGSNLYWAMETFKRYYMYTGDSDALLPAKKLIDRMEMYRTPSDWAWPNILRTQDDTADGVYEDEWGGVDKFCLTAIGYLNYSYYTGELIYKQKAEELTREVIKHFKDGDANHSPISFIVNLKTGEVIDPYCSNMMMVAELFDMLLENGSSIDKKTLESCRDRLVKWTMEYPMKTDLWSGYYEDVRPNRLNLNHQNPLETARYIMNHPEVDKGYMHNIPRLAEWTAARFGVVRRYGATSIKEQDGCFLEMSSHTARYASIMARWSDISGDEKAREEARASFALSTYSACNKHSNDSMAVNYVGIEYVEPWFSDSYWDYLPHFIDGMAYLPEMLAEGEDRIFSSTTFLTKVSYNTDKIAYTAFKNNGTERVKLTFRPVVYADGKPLPTSQWHFGNYKGTVNILTINRAGQAKIEIRKGE